MSTQQEQSSLFSLFSVPGAGSRTPSPRPTAAQVQRTLSYTSDMTESDHDRSPTPQRPTLEDIEHLVDENVPEAVSFETVYPPRDEMPPLHTPTNREEMTNYVTALITLNDVGLAWLDKDDHYERIVEYASQSQTEYDFLVWVLAFDVQNILDERGHPIYLDQVMDLIRYVMRPCPTVGALSLIQLRDAMMNIKKTIPDGPGERVFSSRSRHYADKVYDFISDYPSSYIICSEKDRENDLFADNIYFVRGQPRFR